MCWELCGPAGAHAQADPTTWFHCSVWNTKNLSCHQSVGKGPRGTMHRPWLCHTVIMKLPPLNILRRPTNLLSRAERATHPKQPYKGAHTHTGRIPAESNKYIMEMLLTEYVKGYKCVPTQYYVECLESIRLVDKQLHGVPGKKNNKKIEGNTILAFT